MEKELFCNTMLEGLIKKRHSSVSRFSLALEIRASDVCQLLNLKASPVLKNGKGYRPVCQKIADHFYMEAQDLFPLELYDPEGDGLSEWPVELIALDEKTESLRIDAETDNDELELSELRSYLEKALAGLNERQKEVFLMRDVLGYTLEEIGEKFNNITKQCVCNTRKTLMRRLKHYSRSRKLKEFYQK
jgi:RNA polymerase sigma factor (sigma-70 family)